MKATALNTSVEHLPANIQAELTEIVAIIRTRCRDSVMIVLFGSYGATRSCTCFGYAYRW